MPRYKDITGQRFGKLVAIEPTEKREGNGSVVWKCQCDCGNVTYVSQNTLRIQRSCGCEAIRLDDLTGKRFGRLTVVKLIGYDKKSNRTKWECVCDCGNRTVVGASDLKSGNTKSCGCLAREAIGERSFKHGFGTEDRLFRIWCGMRRRCDNEKAQDYERYGARGIRVCQEWEDSFLNFREWALANGYQDNLTIDRKDNNGDYCPENCRWADCLTQNNNRRSNVYLTCDGMTMTIADWARKVGIKPLTIAARKRAGWSDEDCVKIRPKQFKPKK